MVEFGLEYNGIEEWGLRKEPWCGFILKVFLCSPTTYYRQIGTTITLRPNQEMALSNWKLLRFRALSSANFRAGDVWLLRPIGSWYVTTLQIYKLIILKKIKVEGKNNEKIKIWRKEEDKWVKISLTRSQGQKKGLKLEKYKKTWLQK